jgi:hypothetical protein
LAIRSWPHVLREDADPVWWPAIDALEQRVQHLKPATATRLRVRLTFELPDRKLGASIEPPVLLRESTALAVGRGSAELFTPEAAAEIASLADVQQRAWGRHLALLLGMAAHDPDALIELAARHAVVGYQHRDFDFDAADYEDMTDASAATRMPAKALKQRGAAESTTHIVPLADPNRYALGGTTSGQPADPAAPANRGVLKAPVTEDGKTGNGSKSPPEPAPRFSNPDIESAARPFIETFELDTRGCTIVRQGPGVGADYFASDGRYIELKAFGSDAPDSLELEATEWRAAQNPAIAERYWVYVVEHLRDGRPPIITALFNPVLDDSTAKEPTGKLKVRGWRSTRIQTVGQFAPRSGPDAEATVR